MEFPRGEASPLGGIFLGARPDNEFEEALVSYQRAAALQRRLGDRSREARAWGGAGEAYAALGRFDEAAAFHRRAAAVHRELGDRRQSAVALDGLANAVHQAQDHEAVRRHRAEALHLLAAFDDPRAARMRTRIETGPGNA